MPSNFELSTDLLIGGVFGLIFCVFLIVARLRYRSLPELLPLPHTNETPDCMVVIPARNEAAIIARAVKSLPHDTVIVVDDHSEDKTAEVARDSGAGVMPAPSLPKGAIGKANACMAGARVLTSKWILFTDADTWFEPGFLNAAVACAEASGLAFLSFYPRLDFGTASEAILSPYAQALFFCGVSPKQDPTAVFNGQCLLLRRDAYEFVGSHGAVLNTMIDDVKLAALARRHRLQFGSVRAERLAHVLLREPFESFHRAAFRFLILNSWMGAMILAVGNIAALWLPFAAWFVWNKQWTAAIASVLLPVLMTMPWYRNPVRAFAAPLAIYGMLPVLWGGLLAAFTGQQVEWKGRSI